MRKQAVFATVALAAAFAAAGGLITVPSARAAAPASKQESQHVARVQDSFTRGGVTCTFSYKAHSWHCRSA